MGKTKKPTGLKITRSGNKLICEWKIGSEDYGDGQQFRYRWNDGKWHTPSSDVSKTQVKKSITIPVSNYYPTEKKRLTKFEFKVRGNRKKYTTGTGKNKKEHDPTWSDWAEKAFTFNEPHAPSVSASLDSQMYNKTTFSWSVSTSVSDARLFRNVEWETMLVRDCSESDGSKLSWKSSKLGYEHGEGDATGTKPITESGSELAQGSCTRWFRVRSRGVAGPNPSSGWKYTKHVYAKPYQAKITSVDCKEISNGYTVTALWTVSRTHAHPVDYCELQYKKATPLAGQVCPSGDSGWTTVSDSASNKQDGKKFTVEGRLAADECLYVRANAWHDREPTLGTPTLVKSGTLTDPSGLTVTYDQTNHRVDVEATNNSAVPDSYLVIFFRSNNKSGNDLNIGIIPAGQTRVTSIQCPNWANLSAYSIGVYAAQGSYSYQTRADGVRVYTVRANMLSSKIMQTGATTPKAPSNVTLASTNTPGKVLVTWNFDWTYGDYAEVTWSDDKDAWDSSSAPQSHTTEGRATSCYIDGLTPGRTWYVRVRLCNQDTNGPWSGTKQIDLATTPATPVLTLSETSIKQGGSTEATWTYYNQDGTAQAYAEIMVDNAIVAHVDYGQSAVLYADVAPGTTVQVKVRTCSQSGKFSAWSDPVDLSVAEVLSIAISSSSITDVTVVDDDQRSRTLMALQEMPLDARFTISAKCDITVSVVRDGSYYMERPDGTRIDGYDGEVIATVKLDSTLYDDIFIPEVSITRDMLSGLLDDGASYKLIATATDGFGQTAEDHIDFTVMWSHQAEIPDATVTVDEARRIAVITPIAPEGYEQGDTCDIYRLSVDRPELIVKDGEFGVQYVDPYPALGEFGGHRIVMKTANGDYITADGHEAWVDKETGLDICRTIIDFGGDSVELKYNMQAQSSWQKGFVQTQYLGGAVQGDWGPAVLRGGTITGTAITAEDQDTMQSIRMLADYAGICHVRTPDGSSFAADVQVAIDDSQDTAWKTETFTLTISRVDPQGYDGMPLDEWEVENEVE